MRGERLLARGSDELRRAMDGVPRAFACCEALNRLPYADQDAIRAAFAELTGRPVPDGLRLVPPLHCDHGAGLRVGPEVFVNHGCTLNDMGGIEIGARTMLGPNVSLLTGGHPTAVAERRAGVLVAPIAVGADVWIGAGAVVLRDVPPATLVAGVPARVLRALA